MIQLKPIFITLLLTFAICSQAQKTINTEQYIGYIIHPNEAKIKLYWKDNQGEQLKNFKNLKNLLFCNNETLLFAMNGGMYQKDGKPVGLYIEDGLELHKLNKNSGNGNFHLKPNGVLTIDSSGVAKVVNTENFIEAKEIKWATQSGPMLLIDGNYHSAFKEGSSNLNIRNGVGILPNGSMLFAMSKELINFYDFATFFKDMGCRNALYLDGFVSRTYLPEETWEQVDGNFGVMIGVSIKNIE